MPSFLPPRVCAADEPRHSYIAVLDGTAARRR
jgi:hypothetical protein